MELKYVAVVAVALVACVTDLRSRRIPNVLTFGAATAGLVFHIFAPMGEGPTTALLGWLIGVAIFFVPFALGGLGGGDVKLLGALGAWLGPSGIFWAALYTGCGRRHGNHHRSRERILSQGAVERVHAAGALARCRDSRVAAVDSRDERGSEAGICHSDFCGNDGGDMAEMSGLRRRLRSERGAELIETALTLPLILLVVVGIIEFGFVFQKCEIVTNAAREGHGCSCCLLRSCDAVARVNQYLTRQVWIPLSRRCPHQPIRMISLWVELHLGCERVGDCPHSGPVSGRDWPLLQ